MFRDPDCKSSGSPSGGKYVSLLQSGSRKSTKRARLRWYIFFNPDRVSNSSVRNGNGVNLPRSKALQEYLESVWYTAKTLYRKLETNVLRNETARPHSQFQYSPNLWALYIFPWIGPPILLQQNRWTERGNKSLTDSCMWKSVKRPRSFISGNTQTDLICSVEYYSAL